MYSRRLRIIPRLHLELFYRTVLERSLEPFWNAFTLLTVLCKIDRLAHSRMLRTANLQSRYRTE